MVLQEIYKEKCYALVFFRWIIVAQFLAGEKKTCNTFPRNQIVH